MYPNREQVASLLQHIHACRFVYNSSLEQKIRAYEQEGQKLSCFDLNTRLPAFKEEHPWLKEVNSQSLQSANKNLDNAFTRFFREKKGFPRFKSKKNPVQSFQVPQHYTVDFERGQIKLPKIGEAKTTLHRTFTGKMKYATVSVTSTGKWFISILVDDGKPEPAPVPFALDTTLGIDVGLADFATLSTGEKVENPRFLKNSLQRLKVLQQRVSRKVKGSKNRKKAIQQLARCHEKVANQRNEFLHNLSNRIVSENQAIAVESLNVAGMQKNHCLARSISDASWSTFFTMLEYKCRKYGKTLLKIGRFEPSSKICSTCGYLKRDLTLSHREWVCPDCGTHHDRDINAAINIKKFALQDQNLVGVAGVERTVEPVDSLPMGRRMKQEAPPERRGVVHTRLRKKPAGAVMRKGIGTGYTRAQHTRTFHSSLTPGEVYSSSMHGRGPGRERLSQSRTTLRG
ncbi:MAG: RNA-guided endonuclease TnpB family protein [Methanoculleus sp.]|nr:MULTISPECIES: RNA-guided endonuclease TnpB family protein [unclassified Methanoculleus]MDD2253412.1 RNA-guided endonuclease TnpB family protein [Methanoculleus sp.]MDD2787182.1 RNA-guided endonuclease TnpB family protein [Methanoculleus sp.]MDD3215009.1 RNA-guided endonuclease TnpB family protein [Methanoculleus sp.]MDD4470282.1 RNA-guided endonuclease TnpB family protein [Methanoculleus sp.]HOI57410.1 RNA-guided endonuclease TnpB family protein [Methanoculleus sp.]